eukprot:COSAG02_NODE_555_length_20407_cov_11.072878_13_plen_71_part_00
MFTLFQDYGRTMKYSPVRTFMLFRHREIPLGNTGQFGLEQKDPSPNGGADREIGLWEGGLLNRCLNQMWH